MMTWNRVDLPEPVLPAMSACWRVPLPICEILQLRRAGTADGHAQFVGRFILPQFRSGGAICSNGTSTRLEFLLGFADRDAEIAWQIPAAAAGRAPAACPATCQPANSKPFSAARPGKRCFYAVRRAQNPAAAALRWSQWMSVNTPQRAPLAAMFRSRFAAVSLKFTGNDAMTRK